MRGSGVPRGDHLPSFRDFMAESGAPLHAISVQDEPDIQVSYESCDWTPQEIARWLAEQGSRFGDTKLIAAESFNFNPNTTDPILQHPIAASEVDIIGGQTERHHLRQRLSESAVR
jgi:glucuronoarabinoxylan endo-1,4-beta-xylanase